MHHDRPSLRTRIASLEVHLRRPAATRTIATVVAGLLAVQGAVLLDRTVADLGVPDVAAAELGDDGVAVAADAAPQADAPATTVTEGTGSTALAAPAATDRPATTRDSMPATTVTAPASATSSNAPADPATQRFESLFPAQASAGQSTAQPATTRWAVLIGVNEHSGRTRDNLGSRQDAEDLAAHLRSLGWRDDHIVLLTDHQATRENIIESFRWLQRKADRSSVVVVHYSGHTKQWPGRDVDGDGEAPDEAMWPSDNRFILDSEVGSLLGKVNAGRLWFNVGACEAAGFNDWGITGPNRIATFSSGEHQKSYEDPSKNNSVWGFFLIQAGMIWGHADANGDGNVTVEEAFRYATPRTDQRTRGQRTGRQTPEVSDRFQGEFDLRIPPPPKPRSSSQPSSDEEEGGLCLLCPRTSPGSLRLR